MKYYLAGLLAVTAGTVYLMTSSWCVYPNQYGMLIAQRAGLAPLFFLLYPLWGSAVSIVSNAISGDIGGALTVMSILAGTISTALFCLLVWEWLALILEEYADYSERLKNLVCGVASCASTLAFSFSVPAWVVSNRSHPAMFGVALLLAGFLLVSQYARKGRALYAYVAVGLFCVAALENINLGLAMLVVLPLLLFLAWKVGHLSVRFFLTIIGIGLATVILVLLIAWQYSRTDAAALRELDGVWAVLKVMVIERLAVLRSTCLSRGWLLVFCVSILPWVVCVFNARNIWSSPKDPSTVMLMLAIFACCASVALNVRISPYALIGRSSIPVTPYVLASLSLAYAIAYLLTLCFVGDRDGLMGLRAKCLAFCLIAVVLTGSVYVSLSNFADCDARSGKVATECAEALVADLARIAPEDSTVVLFSDGSIDAQIILAAIESDFDLLLVSQMALQQDHYRRHFESRLSNMSQRFASRLGTSALFTELTSAASSDTVVAVQRPAGMWDLAGRTAVPKSFFYAGVDNPTSNVLSDAVSCIRNLWEDLQQDVPGGIEDVNSYGDRVAYICQGWLSTAANNAGVAMQDLGRITDAAAAYQLSLLISDENISAAMNLLTLIRQGSVTGDSEDLQERIKAFVSRQENPTILPWVLESRFGKVRSPLSLLWKAGLMRKMGLHELARQKQVDAAAMTGLEVIGAERATPGEIVAKFKADIEKDPFNAEAIRALIRLYISNGQIANARELFDASKKEIAIPDAEMLEAGLLQAEGNISGCKAILQRIVASDPSRVDSWGLLVQVLSSQGDKTSLSEAIPLIRRTLSSSWVLPMAEAQLASMDGDYSRARNRFTSVMAITGVNPSLLEELIKLSFRLRDSLSVEKYAKQLIAVDPENAWGYHALGVLFVAEEEFDMAEYCLLRALRAKRAANILNDLAWLYSLQGRLDEAEKLARESIGIDGKAFSAWDTLGVILMNKESFAESEEALLKASELSAGAAGVKLHLAEVLLKMNEKVRATKMLRELIENLEQLPPEDEEKVREMLKAASAA